MICWLHVVVDWMSLMGTLAWLVAHCSWVYVEECIYTSKVCFSVKNGPKLQESDQVVKVAENETLARIDVCLA